ncbi:MAG: hypothetical protein LBF60_02250 [Treponema sp.]|nr:hypothetical protein [Treponema sp.]
MDRRCFRRRTRLLGLALIRVAAYAAVCALAHTAAPRGFLFAQEKAPAYDADSGGAPEIAEAAHPDNDPAVADWLEITFSSPDPVSNVPWTITFLVDYPYPPGVLVHPPEFPEELVLEEVRVEPRLIAVAADERRSAVRFTFMPQRAAQVILGPFEVRTPQRSAVTEEMPITIKGANRRAGTRHPYFTWESGENSFTIGKSGDLFMRLHDWDDEKKRPQNLFRFEAPEHAIMEEHPLTQAEAARNIVLHLTLIPLEGSEITINRHHFQYEGYTLEIPQLRLNVAPQEADHNQRTTEARDARNAPPASLHGGGDAAPFSAPFPTFSVDTGALPHVLRNANVFGIDSRIDEATMLLRQRRTAEALALIRKTERDHTFGPLFVSGRRELERLLALEPVHDESWMPKTLCLVLFACDLACLLFFTGCGFLTKKWNIIPVIVAAVLLPALFFAFTGITRTKEAVLHDSDAFYVPEMNGETQTHFNEGQCAFVRSISGDWVFVETFDNRTGWVRREDMVFY